MACAPILLTAVERQSLEAATQSLDPRQLLRSQIVLAAAAGMRNAAIAAEVKVDADTVTKWRRRFAAERLHGLLDQPRPGAPRQITDDEISDKAKHAQAEIQKGTRLTLRSLADTLNLTPSTVRRRLVQTGLLPHWRGVPELIVTLPSGSVSDIVGAFSALAHEPWLCASKTEPHYRCRPPLQRIRMNPLGMRRRRRRLSPCSLRQVGAEPRHKRALASSRFFYKGSQLEASIRFTSCSTPGCGAMLTQPGTGQRDIGYVGSTEPCHQIGSPASI